MLYKPLAQTTVLLVSCRGAAGEEYPSTSQYVTELQGDATGGATGLRDGEMGGKGDAEGASLGGMVGGGSVQA
jgi:hypothetical protein